MSKDAFKVLEETSRTFYIPIVRLPDGLREAVASAYLCMRSIDEVEDRRDMDPALRAELLRAISHVLQASGERIDGGALRAVLAPHESDLPEVTLRIGEWCQVGPADVRMRVGDAIAAMADRMAWWVDHRFVVRTEADLNRYTYAVAGAVGLLLSDLWTWYDGTHTDRTAAIGFGRGLQAVNILRNRDEDLTEGIDFFPDGWGTDEMHAYAERELRVADQYTLTLPKGPVRDFCALPLRLAHATLTALAAGRAKLTRDEVTALTAPDRDDPGAG